VKTDVADDHSDDDSITSGSGDSPPAGIDVSTAHIARVYNYWLGGKDNYVRDREAAGQVIAAYPPILASVRAQREFLGRAVRYLAAEAGIRQFLDIGTGLPSAGNTHELAQQAAPEAKIVYVDNDPIVLTHSRALLTSSLEGLTAYLEADLRDVGEILQKAAGVLDFDQPVAVMLVGVLHCIPDADDPAGLVERLLAGLAPGSYLVIAHPANDIHATQIGDAASRLNRVMEEGVTLRSHAQVSRFLDGVQLVEPGLVQLHRWRPGPAGPVPDHELANYGAIGQRP
jgi:SAM-dependent methyltransferase